MIAFNFLKYKNAESQKKNKRKSLMHKTKDVFFNTVHN